MNFRDSSPSPYRLQLPARSYGLIKKALGINSLPINRIDKRLDFPWFSSDSTPEEIQAYMKFITALVDMAKNQKRITAKEKTVDNEKYAFRCFLLRLGFIGAEYKACLLYTSRCV